MEKLLITLATIFSVNFAHADNFVELTDIRRSEISRALNYAAATGHFLCTNEATGKAEYRSGNVYEWSKSRLFMAPGGQSLFLIETVAQIHEKDNPYLVDGRRLSYVSTDDSRSKVVFIRYIEEIPRQINVGTILKPIWQTDWKQVHAYKCERKEGNR